MKEIRTFYIAYPKDGEIIGRYFNSTLQNVLKAEGLIKMDYAMKRKAYVYMTDFFHYLGMELNQADCGYDGDDGYLCIEFDNYVEQMDDGSEIFRIDVKAVPTEVID